MTEMLRIYGELTDRKFWEFWLDIYKPMDPDCDIHVAVRKVIHWERVDILSREEFRERVIDRIFWNLRSGLNRQLTDKSLTEWKASIRNMEAWLTGVARRATIDEARKILRLRTKSKRLKVISPSEYHDSRKFVLDFLRADAPFPEKQQMIEHFRRCEQCVSRLAIISGRIHKVLHSGEMDSDFVALMKILGLKKEAIRVSLVTRDILDRDLACLQILDNNSEPEERREKTQFLCRKREIVVRNLALLGPSAPKRRSRHLSSWLIFENGITGLSYRLRLALYFALCPVERVRPFVKIIKLHSRFMSRIIRKSDKRNNAVLAGGMNYL